MKSPPHPLPPPSGASDPLARRQPRSRPPSPCRPLSPPPSARTLRKRSPLAPSDPLDCLCSDGHVRVSRITASHSALIRNILGDEDVAVATLEDGECQRIPLPLVTSHTLALVLRFCGLLRAGLRAGRAWSAAFPSLDDDALLAVLAAANYLDVQSLCREGCAAFARIICSSSPEQMRRRFGLKRDLPRFVAEGSMIEPILTPPRVERGALHDAVIERLGSYDMFEACLEGLDAAQLRKCKALNRAWREAARGVMRSAAWQAREMSLEELLTRCTEGAEGGAIAKLRQNPELARKPIGPANNLPLGYAVLFGGSPALVRQLLHDFAPAVAQGNSWGERPLHLAMRSDRLDVGALELLLRASSAPAPHLISRAPNREGMTPLHLAAKNTDVPEAAFALLLRADPVCARIADNYGRVPLHLASHQPLRVYALLLRAYEPAARCADQHGLLPLTYATKVDASNEHIALLLDAWPPAILSIVEEHAAPMPSEAERGSAPRFRLCHGLKLFTDSWSMYTLFNPYATRMDKLIYLLMQLVRVLLLVVMFLPLISGRHYLEGMTQLLGIIPACCLGAWDGTACPLV